MAHTDIILPMSRNGCDYMAMIVDRSKTHEFCRVKYLACVKRIWFYETAPVSAITHVCESGLGSARPKPSDADAHGWWKLPEAGLGNVEFNTYHSDWDGYDFAYTMVACWRLRKPVTLADMKAEYGVKGAPRGMIYTPAKLLGVVRWGEQERLW